MTSIYKSHGINNEIETSNAHEKFWTHENSEEIVYTDTCHDSKQSFW